MTYNVFGGTLNLALSIYFGSRGIKICLYCTVPKPSTVQCNTDEFQ